MFRVARLLINVCFIALLAGAVGLAAVIIGTPLYGIFVLLRMGYGHP
jgi:hypothetical protein